MNMKKMLVAAAASLATGVVLAAFELVGPKGAATVVLAETTTTRGNSFHRIQYEFSRNFTVPAVFFSFEEAFSGRQVP